MRTPSSSRRWTIAVIVLTTAVFLAGLGYDPVFELMTVDTSQQGFSDTVAILAAGEARQAGIDVYDRNPLDPYGRPHVYGAIWLVTGSLGLVRSDAWWIGLSLAAAYILVAAVTLAPKDLVGAAISLSLLASPIVMLGLQRGNNDIIIFVMLATAAGLVARSTPAAAGVGAGFVTLAMALKLYPAAALPLLGAFPGTRRKRIALLVAGGALCAAVLLLSWSDYRRVIGMAPFPLSIFSYGLKLSYYTLLVIPDKRLLILAGMIPVVVFAAYYLWRRRDVVLASVPDTGFSAGCYVAGAACWVFCYVVTMNYPYRLMLLVLPARLWLEQRNDARFGAFARIQLVALVLFFWLCWWKAAFLVTENDRVTGGPDVVWTVVGAEQAIAFSLTIAFAVSLAGWAWRLIRDSDPGS